MTSVQCVFFNTRVLQFAAIAIPKACRTGKQKFLHGNATYTDKLCDEASFHLNGKVMNSTRLGVYRLTNGAHIEHL